MKLKITKTDNFQKDPAKMIQLAVFTILLLTFAWCFWIYYDTIRQVEKTGTSNVTTPATLNETKINQVLEEMEQRQEKFITPPNISYDPFQ
jgi:preprotein translocase subunit SecF